jgi:hypothetical protein
MMRLAGNNDFKKSSVRWVIQKNLWSNLCYEIYEKNIRYGRNCQQQNGLNIDVMCHRMKISLNESFRWKFHKEMFWYASRLIILIRLPCAWELGNSVEIFHGMKSNRVGACLSCNSGEWPRFRVVLHNGLVDMVILVSAPDSNSATTMVDYCFKLYKI